MSDFTGITIASRTLHKNAVYRGVPDGPAAALPPAPVRAVAPTPLFTYGSGNPVAASSASGAQYVRGTNQWGQQTTLYIPPNPVSITIRTG